MTEAVLEVIVADGAAAEVVDVVLQEAEEALLEDEALPEEVGGVVLVVPKAVRGSLL